MKLNLGSGNDYREDYLNVDKYSPSADLMFDLETFPWPWETDSVNEVLLRHVLEHLGQQTEVFLNIMKELYRVCSPGASVIIDVPYPHPLHSDYLGDPTHCRPITAEALWLFNRGFADQLIANKAIGTPLAIYLDTDFVMVNNKQFTDSLGNLQASQFILKVRKPIKLAAMHNGLGDICMALGTAHALSDAGYRVYLTAFSRFHEIIKACPYVYSVSEVDREGEIWTCAWNNVQARHQVDEGIKMCGIDYTIVNPESKSVVINIPKAIKQNVADVYPGRDRIIIHPSGSVPMNRRWPKEYWQELVNRLVNNNIEIISTGMVGGNWRGSNATYVLDNVIEAFDLPILEAIALYNQCKLLVSVDSAPIQLAGATDCGILGLYSVVLPEYRLPFRHGELGWNAHGILTPCKQASCYNKLVEDHDFIWSDLALSSLGNKNLPDLLDTWCLNEEDPTSCMRNISVDSVYNKVMEMYYGA